MTIPGDDPHEAVPAFLSSHPIEVRFCDDEGQPVLRLDDGHRHETLTIHLRNTSPETVTFGSDRSDAPSWDIAVRFRRGTLSARSVQALKEAAPKGVLPENEWRLARPPDEQEHDTTIELKYIGTRRQLDPGESRQLYLRPIGAAHGVGTRGTTLELLLGSVWFGANSTRISGRRTHYMHIGDQASADVPLRIAFRHDNRIVNDGITNNVLVLCVINQSGRDIELSARDDSRSRFFVYFDNAGDEARRYEALTINGDARNVTVSSTLGTVASTFELAQRVTDNSNVWSISPNADRTLKAGESFDIMLDNIVSPIENGAARIQVRYENVGGYRAGALTCEVVRSGLLFQSNGVRFSLGRAQGGHLFLEGAGDNSIALCARNRADSGPAKQLTLCGGDATAVETLVLNALTVHVNGALRLHAGPALQSVKASTKDSDPANSAIATEAFVREHASELAAMSVRDVSKRLGELTELVRVLEAVVKGQTGKSAADMVAAKRKLRSDN